MKRKPFYRKFGTLMAALFLALFLFAGCGSDNASPPLAGTPNPPGTTPPGGINPQVPPGPGPVTPTDADGDGVPDSQDAFPNDAAASVDSDGDGFPDAFNAAASDAQLNATNLILDAFPNDPAAAVDTDGDGLPDDFNPNATAAQIAASTLVVDDDDDNDLVLDVDDAAPLLGISDIPTESPFGASPLDFGNGLAGDFEQQMIRFEEFGPEAMPTEEAAAWSPLPQPQDAQNGPVPAALESFLAQAGVSPFPAEFSNVNVESPWKEAIEAYLGRPLEQFAPEGVAGPAEGRPSGEDWAHQSWDKLYPKKFFKTTVAQSRVNEGLRNARQRHAYARGEFAPGGLYNRVFTFGDFELDGTTSGIAIKFHPNLPVQAPNSLWTFDGTLPPKLLQARYGEPILMRNYNSLPMDVTANNGHGRHTITTHEHNGHQPGESDGFAGAFFYPGQFYDYRWPLQLAGYSSNNNAAGVINPGATEDKAAIPCEAGETFTVLINGEPVAKTCDETGRVNIPGDWRETMSTHWFHDHMIDHTAENVYKGNATMMNYHSALDRGNEAIDDGVNLRFPSGTELSWGNRDYDVNLVVADKAWDLNGQLWFNTQQLEGFLGDQMTVNFLYKPFFDVRARKYRFRILNGSVSRIMAIGLVQEVAGDGGEMPGPEGANVSYNRVPFHMIANDGNIMEHTVPFDGSRDFGFGLTAQEWKGQLPSQTIAERYDIIVDFSQFAADTKLYFVNIMEHEDGKGTKSKVPVEDILSGKYNAIVKDGRWINGDPGVGKFMELRVQAYTGTDLSMNPADYEPGKAKLIPLAIDRAAQTVNGVSLATARHHTFEFVRSGGGVDDSSPAGFGLLERDDLDELTGEEVLDIHGPWFIRVDGSARNAANVKRISAIQNGDLEVWTIKTGRGWTHPVHIHFEEGIILTRGGKAPPEWEKWARKDMYRIGPEDDSTGEVEIAFRARDFLGHYVQHCHNTMHEDHAMLMRWDARLESARLIDTPIPTWDGVLFEPSFVFDEGVGFGGDGIGPEKGVPVN
jgi:FtsP/CotA-like multicopper oxidase with cupredoxin domain